MGTQLWLQAAPPQAGAAVPGADAVALAVYVRGLEAGALQVGDPIRVAVGLFPARPQEVQRLSIKNGAPWTSAVRVRLHREDGRAVGSPALVGGLPATSAIEFTVEQPAWSIWRWPGEFTGGLPPGVYRVSARLMNPGKGPPLAIAETAFTLVPAPAVMSGPQRARWYALLAFDAQLAGDPERARQLVASALEADPAHAEALRLQAALAAPAAASATVRPSVVTPPPAAGGSPSSKAVGASAAERPLTEAKDPPASAPDEPGGVAVLVAAQPAGAVLQWAATAEASSEYRPKEYGRMQAVGPPDVPRPGDHGRSWATKTPDAGREWLELGYAEPVHAIGVVVVQNFNPGAIVRIDVLDARGAALVTWSGPDTNVYARDQIGRLQIAFPRTSVPVARVRLTLDTSRVKGWNEIDAVALVH